MTKVSRKRTAIAVSPKTGTVKKAPTTFSLKNGDTYRANYREVEIGGNITLYRGYIRFNYTTSTGVNGFFDVPYNTPGRISERKLKENKITNFRLARKEDVTKFKNKAAPPFSFNSWQAVPGKVNNKPGFIFGCGDVKLPTDDITNYLQIRKIIVDNITSTLTEQKLNDFVRVQTIVSNRGGMANTELNKICAVFKIK